MRTILSMAMVGLLSTTILLGADGPASAPGAGAAGATTAPAAPSRPAPATGEPIVIGVTLPLSGSVAAFGQGARDGILLRVKEINDAGGIGGRPIKIVMEDNRGQTADTRNSFKKLAEIDRAVAVIGPLTSTSALAVKMDAAQLQVPTISPTATNDKVTQNCRYMFRACYVDSFQGRVVANYAYKDLKIRKAAALVDKNSDYSKGLVASFRKAFEAAGGKVVAEEGYQQRDTDFGPQLQKVVASGAEILFVPGYPPELPLIIRQAQVVGFQGRLCGADGWDNPAVIEQSGDNIIDCFLVGAFSPEDKRPEVQRFVAAAKAETKRVPGSFEALGYDSVSLLAEAMKNGVSREQVRDGLAKLKDVEAVTGKITITPQGDAEKDAVILKVVKEGGKYMTKYLATVSP